MSKFGPAGSAGVGGVLASLEGAGLWLVVPVGEGDGALVCGVVWSLVAAGAVHPAASSTLIASRTTGNVGYLRISATFSRWCRHHGRTDVPRLVLASRLVFAVIPGVPRGVVVGRYVAARGITMVARPAVARGGVEVTRRGH